MKFDPTSLKFDEKGLVPAIAQDHENGDVLMMAWMNAEAIQRTLDTGRVTYWSRSRQEFWEKGLTSGHTQKLMSLHIDCDRDCILMKVEQIGAACHTNRRHCFFVDVTDGTERETLKPIS